MSKLINLNSGTVENGKTTVRKWKIAVCLFHSEYGDIPEMK